MDYRDEAADSPTIKHRLISSCLLSPFRRHNNHHLHLSSPRDRKPHHHRHPSLTRGPSRAWGSRSPVRRRTSDGDLASTPGRVAAVGKEKCMQFISRIGCGVGPTGGGGGGGGGGHRRRHSVGGGDFHYDALSYSLNFDDGNFDDDVSGELPSRDFSSRLPQSPPPPPPRNRNREIQCSY